MDQETVEMLEKSFRANVSMCYPGMNVTKQLFLTRGHGIISSKLQSALHLYCC